MARPNTREDIVQAGLKCLVEKGFNAVGVQDITDAAGVPKGSFYNHFESKEALGVEIVERYGANQTRREILTDPSVPPLQRLRRHFDRISKLYADTNFTRNCILGGFSAELANQSETIRESLRTLYCSGPKTSRRLSPRRKRRVKSPTRRKPPTSLPSCLTRMRAPCSVPGSNEAANRSIAS